MTHGDTHDGVPSTDIVLVRTAVYHDSVTLMLIGRDVSQSDGVTAAIVLMATPLNLRSLSDQGFNVPDAEALTPNDLVIAIRARDEACANAAIVTVEERLSAGFGHDGGSAAGVVIPRSLRTLLRRRPDRTLAVISVPGRAAAYEVASALQEGAHVFCFSSGIELATEVELKQEAARRGLLLMGPDCGTAIIGGSGLGFANRVRRGGVGIVAASGTGAQQVACLLDEAGVGISELIGVGGRDLSAAVGGTMTLHALELLDRDDPTEVIVVISKRPDGKVAREVAERAASLGKPVVLTFPYENARKLMPAGVRVALSLEEAARSAAELAGASLPRAQEPLGRPASPGWVRGLYSGGTLCQEAMAAVAAAVGRVSSNIPLEPGWRLEDASSSDGHTFIDFGAEGLTDGRPHPMIDYSLRLERIEREVADPGVSVLLLDVVLGYGAHPDPSSALGPLITEAICQREDLNIVVALCGTRDDPQGLERQRRLLEEAGATVTRSNRHAAALAIRAVQVEERLGELT